LILGCSLIVQPSITEAATAKKATGIRIRGDPQADKARVNLKDKIENTIEAVGNRVYWLKRNIGTYKSGNVYAPTDDELKSLALSIKSDIDKVREDVHNYTNNGDINISERDVFLNKISGKLVMLKDLRVVDAADLEKT
jgi:hypothetical protein